MLDLVFAITTVVLTLSGAGWLLKVEWDQGRCAYIVFEQTHANVSGSAPLPLSGSYGGSVRIDSQPDSVQGSADCGGSSEQVSLPRLDPSSQQFDPEETAI